jgi:hypothetical protein
VWQLHLINKNQADDLVVYILNKTDVGSSDWIT